MVFLWNICINAQHKADNSDDDDEINNNNNNNNNKYYKETVIIEKNFFATFPLFVHVVVKLNILQEFSEWIIIIIIISAAAEQAHIPAWRSGEINIRFSTQDTIQYIVKINFYIAFNVTTMTAKLPLHYAIRMFDTHVQTRLK
jgi:uncharacterized protein (DUF486 family)